MMGKGTIRRGPIRGSGSEPVVASAGCGRTVAALLLCVWAGHAGAMFIDEPSPGMLAPTDAGSTLDVPATGPVTPTGQDNGGGTSTAGLITDVGSGMLSAGTSSPSPPSGSSSSGAFITEVDLYSGHGAQQNQAAPEPGVLGMLLAGLSGVLLARRRRRDEALREDA